MLTDIVEQEMFWTKGRFPQMSLLPKQSISEHFLPQPLPQFDGCLTEGLKHPETDQCQTILISTKNMCIK